MTVGVHGIATNAVRYVRNGRRVGNRSSGRGGMVVTAGAYLALGVSGFAGGSQAAYGPLFVVRRSHTGWIRSRLASRTTVGHFALSREPKFPSRRSWLR